MCAIQFLPTLSHALRYFSEKLLRFNLWGGQSPIIHLEADLRQTVDWATKENLRWAFTTSNAATSYFDNFCDLKELDRINWDAVSAQNWQKHSEGKQAEFLVETRLSWHIISRIGVYSRSTFDMANQVLKNATHKPLLNILPGWYYN